MIACSVNNIGKMYGGNSIFSDLSFEIQEKDKIGLVGRNGGGKTTLFKLLAGVETPDSGAIHWRKGTEIGYLQQIPDYPETMKTRDILLQAFSRLIKIREEMNVLEQEMSNPANEKNLTKLLERYGVLQDQFTIGNGYEIEAQIDRIANGLNIQPLLEKSFANLSGGEKTKVGLAMILLKNPDLLLLDEPTNHLDLMAVEWLGEFLKSYEGTVLIISHDRYFLDEVATKILDLEDGEIHTYHSNYSGFVKEKEERLLKEFQAYEEQQKKIKKMREAIKRLREWANRSNPPSDGLHRRATNMERALERMEKLNRPVLNRKKMGIELESSDRSGKDVVLMTNVSKTFPNQKLFSGVNMHIHYKERVAIVGENGTGKSTLLKMILQNENADEGDVYVGSNVKVGYLSQHVYETNAQDTVLEAFRNEISVTEGEARNILAGFLFYGHAVFRKVGQLSGGERMRLRLAQLMHQDINFLILDEPTNHLDIDSREVLEEALENYDGTILAVSHDRYFLNKLFKKIYWIENKQLHGFDGDYTWAKGKMAEQRLKAEQTVKSKSEQQIMANQHLKNHQQLKSKQQLNTERQVEKSKTNTKRLKTETEIERELESLEAELQELNHKLGSEIHLEELQSLYNQKQLLEVKQEELYKTLLDLSS